MRATVLRKYMLIVSAIALVIAGGIVAWYLWFPQPSPASGGTPAASITIVPAALTKEGVPEKLGALTLTKTVMGADALTELTQMHAGNFELTSGYRADYSLDGSQATLWVGQAKDAAAAQAMVDAMAEKIGAGNATFGDLQMLNISGRKLYTATGQDQQHFFYSVNDKIVWLAADPEQGADALHSMWSAVK